MNRRKQNALTVKQAIAELEKIPKRERATHYPAIWAMLGIFEWDKRLGEQPSGWDNLPCYRRPIFIKISQNSRLAITIPIMEYLEANGVVAYHMDGMDNLIKAIERSRP